MYPLSEAMYKRIASSHCGFFIEEVGSKEDAT